jgi:hypothetical protein
MTAHVAYTNVLLVTFTSLDKLKRIEPPSRRSRSPYVPGYDGQEPHAFELTTLLASISVTRPSSSGLMADYVAAIRRFRYHLGLVLSNSLSTETYLETRGRDARID